MEQVILSDENCGKHAEIIFHALERLDYIGLLSLTVGSAARESPV